MKAPPTSTLRQSLMSYNPIGKITNHPSDSRAQSRRIENCNRIFHVENGKVIEIDKTANTAPQGNLKQDEQMTIDAIWKDGKFLAG